VGFACNVKGVTSIVTTFISYISQCQ